MAYVSFHVHQTTQSMNHGVGYYRAVLGSLIVVQDTNPEQHRPNSWNVSRRNGSPQVRLSSNSEEPAFSLLRINSLSWSRIVQLTLSGTDLTSCHMRNQAFLASPVLRIFSTTMLAMFEMECASGCYSVDKPRGAYLKKSRIRLRRARVLMDTVTPTWLTSVPSHMVGIVDNWLKKCNMDVRLEAGACSFIVCGRFSNWNIAVSACTAVAARLRHTMQRLHNLRLRQCSTMQSLKVDTTVEYIVRILFIIKSKVSQSSIEHISVHWILHRTGVVCSQRFMWTEEMERVVCWPTSNIRHFSKR